MSLLRRWASSGGDESRSYSLSQLGMMFAQNSAVSVSSSGDVETALGHPAVYRSVNKIAGIVAGLPVDVYRNRTEVTDLPSVVANPSPDYMRPSAWKGAAARSMLLGGGAYALIRYPVRRGTPAGLDLIDSRRVSWDTDQGGWLLDSQPIQEFPLGPLWQVPLMTLPGSPKGVNPLEYARRTTYAGLAASEFGGNFFRDGAHPSAIVKSSDKGLDPEAAKALKQRLREVFSGNSREPLVLPADTEFHQIQISPEDSQFIELMGFTSGQVAGFFGLMPEHVGYAVPGGASVQYSNRENRQADLLQDAVMPVLGPLEEALTDLLPRPQTVKFNVDALLRPDTLTRYQAHEIALRSGFKVVNEVRELEDDKPLPGGDDPAPLPAPTNDPAPPAEED